MAHTATHYTPINTCNNISGYINISGYYELKEKMAVFMIILTSSCTDDMIMLYNPISAIGGYVSLCMSFKMALWECNLFMGKCGLKMRDFLE